MIVKAYLLVLASFGLSIFAHAQQNNEGTVIQLRAVLHDPSNPVADLYLPDKSGSVVKLELRSGGLSSSQATKTVNGSIVFYNSATVDPEKPKENLAASVKVPQGLNRAIAIIIPGPAGSSPAYRAVLLDDSTKGFPYGEARVLSLIPVEAAIQAGEHKIPISPGKFAEVPKVKEKNEFNMAQTNFYYKKDDAWVAFTERQTQYLDEFRRVFIISAPTGSSHPMIRTIVDTAPAVLPDPT